MRTSPKNRKSQIIFSNLKLYYFMATNGAKGSGRQGAVRGRTQFENPQTGLWTKRDSETGQFMDVKTTGGKFKGVTKEK
jgi:hypothetical protein